MESHRPSSSKESIYTALLALLSASIVLVVLLDSEHIFPGQWTYRVEVRHPTVALPRLNTSAQVLSAADHPRLGYIAGMRYSGQQGAGVSALFALQRWVKDVRLPMVIVEPFIQNSVLGSHRRSGPDVKFSEMFNLENFNRVSRREGVAEVVPWETYLARSPVRAILVKARGVPRPGPVPPPVVEWFAQPNSSECWQSVDGRNYTLDTSRRLCYVRVVVSYFMFVSSHTLSAEEVCNTVLGGLDPTSLTIVFTLWRAPWKVDGPPSLLPPSCAYATGGEGHEVNESVSLVSKLQDSPRLLRDVENYQKQFLSSSGRSYVAVMLRGEHAVRMLYQNKRASSHFNLSLQLEDCLGQAVSETSAVLGGLGTQDVFVTADVGLYGSSSWQSTIPLNRSREGELERVVEQIKHTVERIYEDKWTFDQWEKTFSQATGGVEDRGYIAALQRAIASHAACLVLFGGGSFHILALRSYVDNRGPQEHCVHFVCLDRKYKAGLYALRDGTAA